MASQDETLNAELAKLAANNASYDAKIGTFTAKIAEVHDLHDSQSAKALSDNSVTLAKLDTAITPRLLPASTGTAGQTLTTTATGAAWRDLPTIPTATESAAGTVTLATTAEAVTGTDTLKAVTSAGVSAVIADTGLPPPAFIHEDGTIALSSLRQVEHGLGRIPHLYTVSFRCITADHGYSVGDEIVVTSMVDGDGSRGYVTWASATHIKYFWDFPSIQNTSGDYTRVTSSAYWRVITRVW